MEIYDFISIDFETANEYRDSACQLGITTVQNGAIKDVKSWIINPEQSFSTFNTSIHGIDVWYKDNLHLKSYGLKSFHILEMKRWVI